MTLPTDCAECGTDLLFALPHEIYTWKGAHDQRFFCSSACIAKSAPLPEKPPLEYDL